MRKLTVALAFAIALLAGLSHVGTPAADAQAPTPPQPPTLPTLPSGPQIRDQVRQQICASFAAVQPAFVRERLLAQAGCPVTRRLYVCITDTTPRPPGQIIVTVPPLAGVPPTPADRPPPPPNGTPISVTCEARDTIAYSGPVPVLIDLNGGVATYLRIQCGTGAPPPGGDPNTCLGVQFGVIGETDTPPPVTAIYQPAVSGGGNMLSFTCSASTTDTVRCRASLAMPTGTEFVVSSLNGTVVGSDGRLTTVRRIPCAGPCTIAEFDVRCTGVGTVELRVSAGERTASGLITCQAP